MSRWIAGIITSLIIQTGFAQKTEWMVSINGNASFFRGQSAAATTTLYASDVPGSVPNVTAAYYGKKSALGAGSEIAVQRVSRKGFITGVSAGYELLKSKVKINQVSSRTVASASGNSTLTHTFINLFPYIGQRFGKKKISFDVNLGFDIGLPLSAHEKAVAETNTDAVYTIDANHTKPSVDLRPRLQLKLQKDHVGIQTSYSFGQVNYYGRMNGADPEAYSNVFRLGVFYRF